ncbi:MCE family protein [Mycobacterium sp. BMJ-28]
MSLSNWPEQRTTLNDSKTPPYKLAGMVLFVAAAIVLRVTWLEFRGTFDETASLTVIAQRSGLSMDPGSKVTFNGVSIGRLKSSDAVTDGESDRARLTLDVDPRYLQIIPRNVSTELRATTVFGNKYISLLSPEYPSSVTLTDGAVLDATKTTTEFNTLFETIVDISQQVDPVKLNQTLTAAAQALDGLGDKFGQSLVNGNDILGDLNARMPQIHRDTEGLADLATAYAVASPELFDGLTHAVTTVRTLNQQRREIDETLIAAVGFGNTSGDILERGGPYAVRGAQDLLATTKLFDFYSPELFCTIRNFHDVAPKLAAVEGGNGYSVATNSEILGAGNPYVYPDNLPRTNAHGGPEGRPGCWQPITRDLWPMPYLVMDTGASIAPYNHFELGQPLASEYVWGRQVGENTINP